MAELDMAWHTLETPLHSDARTFEKSVSATWPIEYIQAVAGYSANNEYIFVHGYESQFYGYQWNEVLDFDLYQYFRAEPEALATKGHLMRQQLLEPGGFIRPMSDYVEFRGSKPHFEAILHKFQKD
jgi:Zn-dependent oligopeptidase